MSPAVQPTIISASAQNPEIILFEVARSSAPVIIIGAAMGVPWQYYRAMAEDFHRSGIQVALFDYSGVGPNTGQAPDRRLRDWGQQDVQQVLTTLSSRLPEAPLIWLGHSVGGQLIGLAPAADQLSGAVLLAAQSGDWRLWPGWRRWAMWCLWHMVIPVLALGRNFPARRLGISSVNVPGAVAREWAAWGRSRGYLLHPKHALELYFERIRCPVLVIGVEDDIYAPPAAVDDLQSWYSRAQVTRWQIKPADIGVKKIGHFAAFRPRSQQLWTDIQGWLRTNIPL